MVLIHRLSPLHDLELQHHALSKWKIIKLYGFMILQ